MTTIGWYVHHHGRGHVARLLAVRPWLPARVIAFSTLPEPMNLPPETEWVQLPRDDDPTPDGRPASEAHPTADGVLHWVPLRHPGHRRRLAAIAATIEERDVAAFVVDVSVEVAVLTRLLGVPTVIMGQPGARVDEPHHLAYRLADRIVCPWPRDAHADDAVEHVLDRVRWVGGISRFDGRDRGADRELGSVLLLGGMDIGADRTAEFERLRDAGRWRWMSAGFVDDTFVDDPWPAICAAEVVVTAAGQNSIADIAAAGARAVVLPQPRPFDEQAATASRLEALGLAVAIDAWPGDGWADVLRRTRTLRPNWSRWGTEGAASRAADAITEVLA